ESTGHRLSPLCPPYATPSSNSSLRYRRSDARIVENGFATSDGVSKSAKVVRVAVHKPVVVSAMGTTTDYLILGRFSNEHPTSHAVLTGEPTLDSPSKGTKTPPMGEEFARLGAIRSSRSRPC